MATEILLYGGVFNFSAELFIRDLDLAKNDEVTTRVNSNGGEVEAAWGIIAKWKEHVKKTLTKVDGAARSMMAYFVAASDEAEALNVSEFLFHRASFPRFLENEPDFFTEARRNDLTNKNKFLREILEAKVDVPKFEKITGVTLDQLFSLDTFIDATLTAAEAKEVGLIDRVINITSSIEAEIEARSVDYLAVAHAYKFPVAANDPPKPTPKPINEPKNDKKMTVDEFKTQHPEAFAEAVALGVTQENDRIGAFMVFVEVDAEAVKKGIETGDNPSQKFFAEMNLKASSKKVVATLENEKPGEIKTDEPEGEEAKAEAKKKEEKEFMKTVNSTSKHLPIKV